jgi:hypothetical protein
MRDTQFVRGVLDDPPELSPLRALIAEVGAAFVACCLLPVAALCRSFLCFFPPAVCYSSLLPDTCCSVFFGGAVYLRVLRSNSPSPESG